MTIIMRDALPENPRIIFMGTPDFAVPTLKALIDRQYPVSAVVTQPDRPKGRGQKLSSSPVKSLALEHHLAVLQPEKASDEMFCGEIRRMEPDLIIVVAFGQILRKRLLEIPRWGVINIHASLLPKLRGAAPLQWAIMNNESVTGLTVMHMDEGMDTGPILFQREIPILQDETAGSLYDRMARLAGEMCIHALKEMCHHPVAETLQDHSLATYAPKIEKNHTLINWKMPVERISALIRALDPKPGAYTLFQGTEVKLFSPKIAGPLSDTPEPGRISGNTEEGLLIEAGQGALLIGEVQYPGRKRLPVKEFLRGFSLQKGTVLGQ